MSKLQDSSISIPVMSLPLKKHKHKNQNTSLAISLLSGATAGATEATPALLKSTVVSFYNNQAVSHVGVRMGTDKFTQGNRVAAPRGVWQSPRSYFWPGAVSGIITVFATQPSDTVKTRDQGAMGTTVSVAVRDIFLDGGRESVLER
ncbi:hypothetical protein J3459_014925 [Metarhizium acridum]|nr:hypothetical protein J3459_014925 [Metarhizium acridum]